MGEWNVVIVWVDDLARADPFLLVRKSSDAIEARMVISNGDLRCTLAALFGSSGRSIDTRRPVERPNAGSGVPGRVV